MILTEYETIYILKPDLTEDVVKAVAEKVTGIIDSFKGSLLIEDDWGKRKLAYPISRNSRGHYVRMHFVGPTGLVAEIERQLRYDDNLLRFLTVKLDEDVDREALMTSAVAAAEARAAAAAARAEEIEDDDYDDDDDDDNTGET
jgi:small subunit ribosomal protein S6